MSATLFALVPLYALADSFAGGSLGSKAKALDEKLPGRAAFWGAVVCAVAGWLAGGPWCAAVALAWLIYRSPGWKVFGGSATPVGAKEIAGTFARHLLALLAVLPVYWAHKDVVMAAGWFGLFAVAATSLSVAYGELNREAGERGEPIDPGVNTKIELARGAAFGLAVALSF